jgi:hypothetical protein
MSVARTLSAVLGISDDEWPFVRSLAGLFLVGSAAATLTASAAKAMFLTANPLSALPYVLMAQALWGLSIALIYTQATARYDVTRRFLGLVLASVASFAGLWSLFGWNPRIASMIAAVWAPGLVQLVVLQTWSLPTTFLPGRTTKRLIPVLAAVATFGAAAGGGLTQVVGAVLETEDLLLLSAALLGALGLFVPGVVRGLRALAPPDNVKGRRAVPSLRSSMLDVIHSPLLSRLALVVFVTQFVSVLVDYQFSGELKARYDKEQLGSFLGTFYWVGNLLVLGVSLLATQRLVRWLGLGLCISGVAMLVGAGSAAYLAGALTAAFPAFYALVATSTAERVGQFALSRNAAQMLLAPLDSQAVERARTLIDGVVYRGASLAASAALVFAAAVPLWGLAVPVILGCVLVIVVALTIEPHYRKALYDALGTGRLQAGGAAGRVLLDASAEQEIVRALASDDDAEIVRGLALVRALGAAPDLSRVEALAARGTEPVSPAALETLEALNVPLSPALAERLLGPQSPVSVLRAALAALGPTETPAVSEAIAGLRDHTDATVSTLARVTAPPPSLGPEPAPEWRSGGTELLSLLEKADLHTRRDLVKLLGQGAVDSSLPPLLRALEDHRMRDETIEALSRFGVRLVPAAAAALAEDTLSETAQVALIHAVTRVREPAARDLLMRASALRAPPCATPPRAVCGAWAPRRAPARPRVARRGRPPRDRPVDRADGGRRAYVRCRSGRFPAVGAGRTDRDGRAPCIRSVGSVVRPRRAAPRAVSSAQSEPALALQRHRAAGSEAETRRAAAVHRPRRRSCGAHPARRFRPASRGRVPDHPVADGAVAARSRRHGPRPRPPVAAGGSLRRGLGGGHRRAGPGHGAADPARRAADLVERHGRRAAGRPGAGGLRRPPDAPGRHRRRARGPRRRGVDGRTRGRGACPRGLDAGRHAGGTSHQPPRAGAGAAAQVRAQAA